MNRYKNLLGRARGETIPYATFEGYGPFGDTTVHLLKTYKKPENELKDQYANGLWQL